MPMHVQRPDKAEQHPSSSLRLRTKAPCRMHVRALWFASCTARAANNNVHVPFSFWMRLGCSLILIEIDLSRHGSSDLEASQARQGSDEERRRATTPHPSLLSSFARSNSHVSQPAARCPNGAHRPSKGAQSINPSIEEDADWTACFDVRCELNSCGVLRTLGRAKKEG